MLGRQRITWLDEALPLPSIDTYFSQCQQQLKIEFPGALLISFTGSLDAL